MAIITENMLKVTPSRNKEHFKTQVNLTVSPLCSGEWFASIRFQQTNVHNENKYHNAFINATEAKQVIRDLINSLEQPTRYDLLTESMTELDDVSRFRIIGDICDRRVQTGTAKTAG